MQEIKALAELGLKSAAGLLAVSWLGMTSVLRGVICVQDCDVYMLDDILSAVDAHVANWLVKRLIQGPLLADKTRIVATHSELCMAAASQVVKLFRGKVSFAEPCSVVDDLLTISHA